jgi:hypothetical protein
MSPNDPVAIAKVAEVAGVAKVATFNGHALRILFAMKATLYPFSAHVYSAIPGASEAPRLLQVAGRPCSPCLSRYCWLGPCCRHQAGCAQPFNSVLILLRWGVPIPAFGK